MRVQGYLDKSGRIMLSRIPPGFKEGTTVWVEIPDDVLRQTNSNTEDTEQDTVLSPRAQKILDQLQEVRERSLQGISKTELTEKEQERWEAFELRSKLREEKGRPE